MGLFGMLGKAYNKLNEISKEYDAKRKQELSKFDTGKLEFLYMRMETSHNDQVLILDILRERYSSLSDSQLDFKLSSCANRSLSACPPMGLIQDMIVERYVMGKYRGMYLGRVKEWEENYRRNNPDLLEKYTRRG